MSTKSDIESDIISSQLGLVFKGDFLAIVEQIEIICNFGLTSGKALYRRLVAVYNWVAISFFSPNKFSL